MTPKSKFSRSASVLPVDDLKETAAYYQEAFGFDLSFMWGEPAHYAVLKRDGVGIHLTEREDTSTKIRPSTVYMFVNDVDALYEEFKARGIEMFSPPETQDYGMREFEVSDPNGHFLIFGMNV